MRVAIVHDGFVPTYRVGLYERLARDGAAEYVVFHGSPPASAGSIAAAPPFAFPNVEVRQCELRIAGTRLVYQRLVRELLTGGYDAVILGAYARFVSTVIAQPLLKASGRPVILWGQATDKERDVGPGMRALHRATARAKLAIARTADGYLAYTAGGARRLVYGGLSADRVFVVRNTLDVDAQRRWHAAVAGVDEDRLRAELGLRPDSAVLVYLGRVYREKRVTDLVDAVRSIRADGICAVPLEVVVIGDGPELPAVRARAAGVEGVRLLGEVRDQAEIARWLRVAAAVVIPGAVGLAINHAFAHGVPLVTRPNAFHGPELDYLVHGVNGLVVDGDLRRFAGALAELAESPARRAALAAGATRTADDLKLDVMVEAFDRAVAAVTRG